MAEQSPTQLSEIKVALTRFATSRTDAPHDQTEREFGELLLYLIRLAEKNGVDLIGASERQVENRANIDLRIVGKK